MKSIKMLRKFLIAGLALTIAGCGGSDVEIGQGAALSTLPQEATAKEIVEAFFSSVSSQSILAIDSLDSSGGGGTKACPLGGLTITNVQQSQTSSTSGSLTSRTEFNDCVVNMNIQGQPYEETLNGTVTNSIGINGSSVSMSLGTGISASGDLGLAIDCNITVQGQLSGEQASASSGGSCTVRDSSGAELFLDGAELSNSPLQFSL